MNLLRKYHHHFSEIPSLFHYQEQVLNNLLNGNDTLAIIPTGGGKSLIFQLMALDLSGITIVISPLIALMQEQVNELKDRGIGALALNSNIPFDEQRNILRNLASTNVKLLYLSPERLQNGIFRASLAASGVDISMLVIDEAHCISQWGQSFRPDYAQINPFVKYLSAIGQHPLLFALTATLAKFPRQAIQQAFQVTKEHTIRPQSVIRENLNLRFTEVKKEDDKLSEFTEFLGHYKPKKTLVYLYSKLKCEKYAQELRSLGYNSEYYHADIDKNQKEKVYDLFIQGDIQILFATTAFGMGINIPNIDAVVHLQIPNSIEEYYQQVGRGWRLKSELKVCQCCALYSETNFDKRRQGIVGEKLTVDDLKLRIKNLIGKNYPVGDVVAKEKEEYLNSGDNLPLIRYKLEEKGIIKMIGEINGSPLKIEMHQNTDLWNELLTVLEGLDSFIWAHEQSGIPIEKIISHLYDQEFAGNIKKLPAIRRDLFFEILKEPDDLELSQVVEELNVSVDQRIADLDDLKSLFLSSNPEEILEDYLS